VQLGTSQDAFSRLFVPQTGAKLPFLVRFWGVPSGQLELPVSENRDKCQSQKAAPVRLSRAEHVDSRKDESFEGCILFFF
jgi:hypothetical protein